MLEEGGKISWKSFEIEIEENVREKATVEF